MKNKIYTQADHEPLHLITHISNAVQSQIAQDLKPGLYLVATPIGHLADITLRALSVLARADIIYCEDTRHSKKLLTYYGLKASLKSYHDHDDTHKREQILRELQAGKRLALISDAGTPLISDPGFKLVRDVITHGFCVESVPGPSAPIMALTLSGLPTNRFLFEGFVASKQTQRRKQFQLLVSLEATLIFFETPNRLAASLADMAEVFGPRQAVVARELSKVHETVRRGTLPDLASFFQETPSKGEVVVVVGPPLDRLITNADILEALVEALAEMSLRDAVKHVAQILDVAKKRVYDLALTLKE